MPPALRRFVHVSCALASFAYAARMKRLGHRYYFNVVATIYVEATDGADVYGTDTYGTRMPSTIAWRLT